jgi:hypothetical protein
MSSEIHKNVSLQPHIWGCGSTVRVVTGLRLGEPAGRGSIAVKVKRFLLFKTYRPDLGASRVPRAVSLE